MFVPHKLYPFWNKYHTIACALSKVIYLIEIIELEGHPQGMGRKDFYDKGLIAGLMVWMPKTLWVTGKVVSIYRYFCDMEGLLLMVEKGIS